MLVFDLFVSQESSGQANLKTVIQVKVRLDVYVIIWCFWISLLDAEGAPRNTS